MARRGQNKGSYSTSMNVGLKVWGNGTDIFVADGTNGVKAFTFNGTTFTLKGTSTSPSGVDAGNVYGDGTYIYVNDFGNNQIDAYTFSGTTWTYKAATSSGDGSPCAGDQPQFVWGDGTYIYAGLYACGLQAYTFNGTAFTYKAYVDIHAGYAWSIFAKNGNIYVTVGSGGHGDGIGNRVFSFNGTTFTYKGGTPRRFS